MDQIADKIGMFSSVLDFECLGVEKCVPKLSLLINEVKWFIKRYVGADGGSFACG